MNAVPLEGGFASILEDLLLLRAEVLGGVDHVDKGCLSLGPLAGLETAVRVDPELVWAEVPSNILASLSNLFKRSELTQASR